MEKHPHVCIESLLLATISKEQRCGATISLSHAKRVSLWHTKSFANWSNVVLVLYFARKYVKTHEIDQNYPLHNLGIGRPAN